MTRRYLLDSGPAFDYLFQRKGVVARLAEQASQTGRRVSPMQVAAQLLEEALAGLGSGNNPARASH